MLIVAIRCDSSLLRFSPPGLCQLAVSAGLYKAVAVSEGAIGAAEVLQLLQQMAFCLAEAFWLTRLCVIVSQFRSERSRRQRRRPF